MNKVHPPLIEAIIATLKAIFDENRPADKVLEQTLKSNRKWGSRDRRFIAESVYDIVRWYRRLHVVAEDFTKSKDKLRAIVGVYGSLHDWDPPPLGMEKDVVLAEWNKTKSAPRAIRNSIPDWMDQLGEKELGLQWTKEIEALNEKAPVDLRANSLKASAIQVRDTLLAEGIDCRLIPGFEETVSLNVRKNVFKTEAFKAGMFEVQDRSSQRVARFLDPQPGDRVVDACAGAGGKSLHLSALMKNKGRVISLDIHEWKLKELMLRARRAGAQNLETRVIDTTKVVKRLEGSADRLLLDVPCTGLGVLRRNPDTKWKLTPEAHQSVRNLQQDILARYSRILKPGGVFVYSTCSLLPSENIQQIEWFLDNHGSEFELEEHWSVLPSAGSGDGFFAARVKRKPILPK